MVEMIAQVLLPVAMIFAMGFYIKRKKLALVIYGVMTVGMLMLLIPTLLSETGGNPALAEMGIKQSSGAMEGKEVHFGPAASALWSTAGSAERSVGTECDRRCGFVWSPAK